MFNQRLKLLILSIMCFALSACMSVGALSHKQVKMLKQQGFVLTDEGWSLGLPESLLFDFDKFEISERNRTEVKSLALKLQKFNLKKVRIVGHTDNVGRTEYNLKLSQKRAESVAQIFIESGYDSTHVETIGRGSNQPLNLADTDQARAENRRVAVIIIP